MTPLTVLKNDRVPALIITCTYIPNKFDGDRLKTKMTVILSN